jgi:hypothetical protein
MSSPIDFGLTDEERRIWAAIRLRDVEGSLRRKPGEPMARVKYSGFEPPDRAAIEQAKAARRSSAKAN